MAEFAEVMRQWGRHCNGYTENHNDECDGCPLEIDGSCNSYAKDNAQYAERIEKYIMSWAAEHPEPVYPTWEDWLKEMGLIFWENNVDDVYPVMVPTFKMFTQIPADIAQKLGIEPR